MISADVKTNVKTVRNKRTVGSAIQVLPFSSFLITAVVVVFISIFISIIENCIFYEFFMYHYEFLFQK